MTASPQAEALGGPADLPPPPRRAPGLRGLYYDRKVRGWTAQIVLLAILAVLAWFFLRNASENMRQAGLATGFGFLVNPAGLEPNFKLIAFDRTDSFARLLLVGLLNTLFVSAVSIVLATVLGFLIGIGRLSKNWLLAKLCGFYVEFVRNVPLLIFILFWYYGVIAAMPAPRAGINIFDLFFLSNRGIYFPLPEGAAPILAFALALVCGIGAFLPLRAWVRRRQAVQGREPVSVFALGAILLALLPFAVLAVAAGLGRWDVPSLQGFNYRGGSAVTPEFVALMLGLSTYTAGFIAEAVRGGIVAVHKGQREAALAAGLTQGQTLRLVVIPQAMRVIVPPLANQYINIIKNSTFAYAIAYPEIMSVFVGSTLTLTGQAVEIMAITLGIYVVINLLAAAFMDWFNRRVRLVAR